MIEALLGIGNDEIARPHSMPIFEITVVIFKARILVAANLKNRVQVVEWNTVALIHKARTLVTQPLPCSHMASNALIGPPFRQAAVGEGGGKRGARVAAFSGSGVRPPMIWIGSVAPATWRRVGPKSTNQSRKIASAIASSVSFTAEGSGFEAPTVETVAELLAPSQPIRRQLRMGCEGKKQPGI